jgi:hypothetical protein
MVDKVANFPNSFFSKINSHAADLNKRLSQQTDKYLQKLARQEEKLYQKMMRVDSVGAKQLFANSTGQYATLAKKLAADTGRLKLPATGVYQPYIDSLQGALHFLQLNPSLLSQKGQALSGDLQAQLQSASAQLQALQAKMQDADQVKAYIRQRQQEISNYISQHANLQTLLGPSYQRLKQQGYYYSEQVKEYKALWNDPDAMVKKGLAILEKLPAFQGFMQAHSQLAGLFGLPGGSGGMGGATAQALPGLQTRSQIGQAIQGQLTAAVNGNAGNAVGGSGNLPGMDLSSRLDAAKSQFDSYKNKITQTGNANSGDLSPGDFRPPNDQKTKALWRRLEYGVNFQTTKNNTFFPTMTDFGLSLGYKLGHSNTIGIGASYKMGWGTDIQHIRITGQGVGLRSFLDIHIKGSFSATGGFEYNYTTPFTSIQQLRQLDFWTKSGLIGMSKTLSMNSRVLKKTKVQLLWDFLRYQQVPRTQPMLFRIGYAFN